MITNQCIARYNKTVHCKGQIVQEAGLCMKHMVLFEIWIDECEGYRVYRTDYPRNWKRSIFHKWLDRIDSKAAKKIFQKSQESPTNDSPKKQRPGFRSIG